MEDQILSLKKPMENTLTKSKILTGIEVKSGKSGKAVTPYMKGTVAKQIDFLRELVANGGLIHKSCVGANIRYSTYRTWIKDPKFKLKLEEAQQVVNEQVEQSLINKFKSSSPVPEIFYLKSRDERYKQVAVLEGNEDKPIVVTHDKKTLESISKTIIDAMKKE